MSYDELATIKGDIFVREDTFVPHTCIYHDTIPVLD